MQGGVVEIVGQVMAGEISGRGTTATNSSLEVLPLVVRVGGGRLQTLRWHSAQLHMHPFPRISSDMVPYLLSGDMRRNEMSQVADPNVPAPFHALDQRPRCSPITWCIMVP